MKFRLLFPVLVGMALAACDTPNSGNTPTASRSIENASFRHQVLSRGVVRSNATLAEDFIGLTFALESGQPLTRLLRYEGPIGVAVRSRSLTPYVRDLDALLNRLRREAGIEINRVSDPELAQIHIVAVPSSQIQRVYPGAACFIVPGETSWNGFRNRPRRDRLRWSAQRTLGTTAIFLPTDSTPQDVRDCLHEEIAQALGTANDIYRLPDSVFNDDNFHSIVTPFDMLMLRTLYDPSLRSGMTKAEVSARAVGILDRINPQGRGVGRVTRASSSPAWKSAIETALARDGSRNARLRSADRAVQIASGMRPQDHRLGVALLTRGRLRMSSSPDEAAKDFEAAHQVFVRRLGRRDLRAAQSALHLAVAELRRGRFEQTLSLTEGSLETALRGENAILASGLYAVRSEALTAMGRGREAQRSRVESLKWARLAFGDSDGMMAAAQAELENLGVEPEVISRALRP